MRTKISINELYGHIHFLCPYCNHTFIQSAFGWGCKQDEYSCACGETIAHPSIAPIGGIKRGCQSIIKSIRVSKQLDNQIIQLAELHGSTRNGMYTYLLDLALSLNK